VSPILNGSSAAKGKLPLPLGKLLDIGRSRQISLDGKEEGGIGPLSRRIEDRWLSSFEKFGDE